MFRKIRSNLAPGSTVTAELYKEFRPYFRLLRQKVGFILIVYPRQVFILMVVLILISAAFSFENFYSKNRKDTNNIQGKGSSQAVKPVKAINDGLDKISVTGSKLRQTLRLRQEVDSVLAKGTLSRSDTIFLEGKLEELRSLQ